MYVFVKHDHTLHLTVFGPATPAECRAWMRMKKLHPSRTVMSERLLPSKCTEYDCISFDKEDSGLYSDTHN